MLWPTPENTFITEANRYYGKTEDRSFSCPKDLPTPFDLRPTGQNSLIKRDCNLQVMAMQIPSRRTHGPLRFTLQSGKAYFLKTSFHSPKNTLLRRAQGSRTDKLASNCQAVFFLRLSLPLFFRLFFTLVVPIRVLDMRRFRIIQDGTQNFEIMLA